MVGSKINVLCTQNVQELLCEFEIRILLEEINYETPYTVQNYGKNSWGRMKII